MVQEKIILKLSVQEEVLKKQLEDVMYGPPERYIPESLLYQQQYQGAEEFNKKQFIPLHFKSSVISIVKKTLTDNDFQQILPSLNEWINEEIENATTLLDPKKVASDFLKEQLYGDEYDSPPTTYEESVAPASSASSAPASSAPASSASSAPASSAPTPARTAPASVPASLTIPSSRVPIATPATPSKKTNKRSGTVNPTRLFTRE
jgi:hypothetical protein